MLPLKESIAITVFILDSILTALFFSSHHFLTSAASAAFSFSILAPDLFSCRRQPCPKQLMPELFSMKRHQWIQIASAAHRPVKQQRNRQNHDSSNISPDAKNCRQHQIDNPHKFQRIAKLQAVLCVVGDCDECHVQHDLTIKPPTLYAELSQNQRRHDRQRCTEHIRGVDRRKLQTVDCKLQQ